MNDEIRRMIDARPERSLQARAAAAAYLDVLALQEAGAPSPVRAARLLAFVDVWEQLEGEQLDADLGTLQ